MSNTGFKIPKHLSAKFNRLNAEERQQMVSEYKAWYNNPFTELLLEDLDSRYTKLLEESEAKNDFITLFQSKYYDIKNKAERKVLRQIKEQLNWKVK